MRLKEQIDLELFFSRARECVGNVYFLNGEGDRLNLKSALCYFLFAAAYHENALELRGKIQCETNEDEALMREFCVVQ